MLPATMVYVAVQIPLLFVAHGPVNTLVPGSILQETNCGYHILGSVAQDVTIDFS